MIDGVSLGLSLVIEPCVGGGIPDGTTLTEGGMGADKLVVWPARTIVEVDYPCIRLEIETRMKLTVVE